ncbi:unnamed protein product [Blepharisma stoltei]|uniref:PAS domain-containing protein n=1 Tax=Blepharisma stoltei TaxID=1481888 RepID=A0AAU9IYB0_9CILI|nr:unnamed protein product [Blepharisma stoltei]
MLFHNYSGTNQVGERILSQAMKKAKRYIFAFFGELFGMKYSRKIKVKQQLLYEIFSNLIIVFQLTTLIWYPNLGINDWSSYSAFWKMIGIVNYSNICGYFEIMDICFYGTISSIGVCLSSFALFGVYFYLKKKPPSLVLNFSRKIAGIIITVCLVPANIILLIVLKNSIIISNSAHEFWNTSGNDLNYGALGVFFSICCLIVLIPIFILSEVFTCDIRHSKSKNNIKARSCAFLDLERKVFSILMCVSYVSFGEKDAIYHQIIWFALTIYLWIKIISFLPYFNPIENALQACKAGSISLSLLSFILGYAMDNSQAILIFALILHPPLLFFIFYYTNQSYKNLKKTINVFSSQYEFERNFRHLLTDPNLADKTKVLNLFNKYWKIDGFKKDKLFVLWEFNFCYCIMQDERLARMILRKTKLCKSSFENDIHEWRIHNWLKNKRKEFFPEISYLEYLLEFGKVKAQDKKLCNLIIQLQLEFSSRSPRMKILVNLASKTSVCLDKVREKYKKIANKYKAFELYEAYASFLRDISCDLEEADLINKKKNGVDYSSLRNENQNLDRYGGHLGLILVSCDMNIFGSIVYINEKAAEILRTPVLDIIGSSIFNFLPSPYNNSHKNLTVNFLENSNRTEIQSHSDLFLQTQNGFLIACNLMIKFASFHNDIYCLISFLPKTTKYEIALISKEGIVLSHSEYFSQYLGINTKYIRNLYVSEVIPFLEIEKMKAYEPWVVKFCDKEIALVYLNKEINSSTLHYLYLIHDQYDIARWKEGKDPEQLSCLESLKITPDLQKALMRQHSIKSCTVSTIIIEKEIEKPDKESALKSYEDEEKNLIENQSNAGDHASALTLKSRRAKKLIYKAKKKIRVLQWVLFLVILTVIVVMIAIILNVMNNVDLTSSMKIFYNLGEILYYFGVSADTVRNLNKEITIPIDISPRIQGLSSIVSELETIQLNIRSDFNYWRFCTAAEVADKPLIPLWSFDDENPQIIYENIYDMISLFNYHLKLVISSAKNNQTNMQHAKFVIANGIGKTYEFLNHTISGLENCEVDHIDTLRYEISTLLVSGFSIFTGLVIIIIWFILLAAKKEDEFWNFMLEHAQIPLMKLRSEAMDRLILVHNDEINPEEQSNIRKLHNRKKVRTKIEIKYAWRILVFFMISASYYYLVYFYLYPECANYMANRPKLLNNFNIKRSLVSRLSIFARDVYNPSFIKLFPKSYDFRNSKEMFNITSQILLDKTKEIRENKFMSMISGGLKQRLFESCSIMGSELYFGSETAIKLTIYDGIYITYQTNISGKAMIVYLGILGEIENEVGEEFQIADDDSYEIINNQLHVIIIATVVYSVALCSLFLLYYLPFFIYQARYLNRFNMLPTILKLGSE